MFQNQFACSIGELCVSLNSLCDGKEDCVDGSDADNFITLRQYNK